MPGSLSGKTMWAGKTAAVIAVTISAVVGLTWCAAVVGHLHCLRYGGVDACCVDD